MNVVFRPIQQKSSSTLVMLRKSTIMEFQNNVTMISSVSPDDFNSTLGNLTMSTTPQAVIEHMNITNEMPIAYAIPLYGYIMPFLLVITIVANTLIVVVLSKRHMRTPTNIVLMAMALCDLLTLLVPAPWLIYMYTFGNHYKPLWPISLCYAWNMMHEHIPNMFHTASIWLTLALAVQRYIYVCHAPLARKLCTMNNVYKCLVYILILAALPQGFRMFDTRIVQVDIIWHNKTTHVCQRVLASWVKDYVSENVYYITYYMFRVVFVHFIPCVALIVLNLLLFQALKKAQQRRDILLSKKNECKKLRDSNCTTLMLIVVVTVFLIVEIPVVVVTLLHIMSSVVIEFLDYYVANSLILFTNFLIILSYPINFAIYCGMSRQFRETFKELFVRDVAANRNGSSRYSLVNGPRTCTNSNETVL